MRNQIARTATTMGKPQPSSAHRCWKNPATLALLLCLMTMQPHNCASQSPTREPSYEPTVLPENATYPPTASPAPTITPSPTREPLPSNATTDAPESSPTDSPTEAPVPPVTSEAPSDVPTEGTVITGTPTEVPTTREPSPGPTTEVPTPGPTAEPGEPTPQPVRPTPLPTVEGVKRTASLSNVVAFYGNVGELSQSEIAQVLAETENWFMASFNNKTYTDRRRRRRYLQSSSGLNPSQSGVRNMLTQLKFRSTQVESNGLRLAYDQDLQWTETVTSYTPEVLAGLPYNYNPTNQELASILKSSVNGFENVGTPLAVPDFPAAPTPSPTEAPAPAPASSGSPLSTGAIVGIAVAGAVGLPLLCYGLYLLCGPGSDKQDSSSSRPGGSTGYVSAGSAPPSKVVTSRDEISAMDYTRDDRESMADYQDQSVATVDYDYSKAYGGAGDNSVVSSAGGTMGDNTRQTAGDAATTAAARAALGASFDSELGGAAGAGTAAGFRGGDDTDGNVKEEIIEINAPAGKLGVVIDTPDDGAPVVHAVKDSSVIANLICVGDKLIAVDDEDVRSMTAIKVSKLISKKSMNPSRKLTIVRTTYIDDEEG